MKNLKLALVALLLLPGPVMAQTAIKVGVIDFQAAAFGSNAGVSAAEQIDARAAEHTAELQGMQNELNDLQTRYETQQRALSAAALTQLETQIARLQRDFARKQEDASLDLETLQAELLNPISARVQQAVLEYAEEQRFTLILPAESVVWASETTNITSEIVRRMNDAAAAGGAGETPPAAPPESPEEPAQ